MNTPVRPVLAEFVGTFLFVLVGCTSVIVNGVTANGLGAVGVAAAHGLAMAVVVTAFMTISGAHLNPAVTVGLLVARRVDGRTAGAYIAAQLAGAVLAALLLRFLAPSIATRLGLGTPQLSSMPGWPVGLTDGIVLEAVFTFLLVNAVFGTAVSPQAPKVGGFGIGLAVFVGALAIGPLTGGALNPARAFGPALVTWTWTAHAVYWIGPLIGGALAGLLWGSVLLPKDPTQVS